MTPPLFIARHLALLLASIPALTLAQHARRPDPADPASPVLAVKYESAFANYQSFQDQKLAPWKDVHTEAMRMSEAAGHTGHGDGAMAEKAPPGAPVVVAAAPSKPASPAAAGVITATGVVQQVDKANAKIKLSHDPIPALGWPKMTMFFRLKDGALADQVKAGDAVEFQLEKSGSGYVISNFAKPAPAPAPTPSPKK
ncbi:MAG: copper-binding protein [Rhodocyclaceae bacterium]|nr:copper-binding protein [Rhodocyclaceae bacterium]